MALPVRRKARRQKGTAKVEPQPPAELIIVADNNVDSDKHALTLASIPVGETGYAALTFTRDLVINDQAWQVPNSEDQAIVGITQDKGGVGGSTRLILQMASQQLLSGADVLIPAFAGQVRGPNGEFLASQVYTITDT